MNISFKRLPFYSVLLAAFVPWADGLTGSSVPGYLFNLSLLGIAGASLAMNREVRLRASLTSWVFAAFFCCGLLIVFILHRLHPLADFLVIVPITLVYTIFLTSSAATSGELLRQLKWLYAFHVLFIVFELLMFYFDSRQIFQMLSGGRYRDISFHLLSKLVLRAGNGAPNSLLLQTQAASHLVASAFLIVYLASYGKRNWASVGMLVLLFVLFLLLITNTSLLVFICVGFMVWMIKAGLKTKVSALLFALLAAYLFLDEFLSVALYRVYDSDLFDSYLWLFTVPISNILDSGLLQIVFGHGLDKDALESGELGFATIAYMAGVYLVGLLFIWLATVLLRGFMCYWRAGKTADPAVAAWRSLLLINIALCAGWALSTIHYLILLIPGGLHLFAFSLAMVILITVRLWRVRPEAAVDKAPARRFGPAHGDLAPG